MALFDLYMEYEATLSSSAPLESHASLTERGSGNLGSNSEVQANDIDDDDDDDDFDKWHVEESLFHRSEEFDILGYWKIHHNKRPRLVAMTHDVLAIPVTIVASKETFSTNGRVIHKYHTRLRP
uniref:HAT C-terminal dimerisation domain-containing protein n=1 Tax=Nelumbo nucifera TaxID=4432 RepID=A0A822ZLS9_NELNU|nr:TPA_asm: hypothetical protein HUJ06_003943 [Nelumbo nucifera]